MAGILFLTNIILLVLLVSTKIGLTAYVAWMEENGFTQPSDKDIERLIKWCVKKYLEDLFGKS